jgi:hypothetical protein
MEVQHVGHKIRGFYRVADYALGWGMMARDAQRRLEILGFWRRHGVAATCEAFKLSRRTLYRWRAKLEAEGGNVAALGPGSTAPKRRRRRQWPALLIAELRRLRTLHPNLAKEKLYLLLEPVAAAHQLPCPSARTIGRLIADAPDQMRTRPRRLGGHGKPTPVGRPRVRKPRHFHAQRAGHSWPWIASSCAPWTNVVTSSPAPICIRTSPGPAPPAVTPAPPPGSSSA